MQNMKSRLVRTLLGTVDLKKIKNKKLLNVIMERISANHFLFNYGDSRSGKSYHNDNHVDRGHSESRCNNYYSGESSFYNDHNDNHVDRGYNERKSHTDTHSEYGDRKTHSEYSEAQGHTDYWDRS